MESKSALLKAINECYPEKLPSNLHLVIKEAISVRGFPPNYLDKGVFNSIQEAGKFLARRWAALEDRYGRKQALVMAAGMLATFPLPGNIMAIVGAAEAIRGIHGYFNKGFSKSEKKSILALKQVIMKQFKSKKKSIPIQCPELES